MSQLGLKATVTVDNSGAVAPLKTTSDVAKQTAADLRGIGNAGSAAAPGLSLVRREAEKLDGAAKKTGSAIGDMIGQVASGTPVAQAFAAQAANLTSGLGTAARVALATGSIAGGVLTAGFVVAAAAAAGYLILLDKGTTDVARFNNKLLATGNAAGLTRSRFDELAAGIAAAGTISNDEAASIATGLEASGIRSRDAIGKIGAATVKLAELTGKSSADIVASFAKAQEAPTRFAVEFAKSYDGITAAQVAHIRLLEEQGKQTEAFSVLADAVYSSLATKVPQELGYIATAWNLITVAVSDAKKAVLDFGKAPTTQVQLDGLRYVAEQQVKNGGQVSQYIAQQISALQEKLSRENRAADATSRATATTRDGVAAADRLATSWLNVGDNARKAGQEVAKFRADIAAALKANPNDASALEARRRAPQIEADIRKKYEPDATAAAKKVDSAAASLAKQQASREEALAASILQIEGEAVATLKIGDAREAELKILELQKQAHRDLTDLEKGRIADALRLKSLYEGVNDGLKTLGTYTPDTYKGWSKAARDKELTDPSSLASIVARIDDGKSGDAIGMRIAGKFRDEGMLAADAIGSIIGSKIGGSVSLIAGSLRGSVTAGFFNTGMQEQAAAPFKKIASGIDNLLGKGQGSFATTAGRAFAGAAQGQIAGSVMGALGIKTSGVGSQIGGAIGGALAPLLGPLGPFAGMIGGALGGVLGNLLAGTKKSSSTLNISGGTSTISTGGNNAALQKASSTQANGLVDGLQALADQLGGTLGNASVSIGQRNKDYVVDPTGKGRTKGTGVLKFKTQEEALQAALADAISDGGVGGVSPRVQSVLHQYAANVNKAVAEALKVKGLEDILANRENPFATAFRDFELQAKQRVDVAKKYGFDVLEIEKINGEARAALVAQTLAQTTSSVKALLDDLKFGSRATGSLDERRSKLEAERDRLLALAKADPTQNDAAAKVISQLIDLSTEAFGKTGTTAGVRGQAVSQLQELVAQTEARINAASKGASGDLTVAKLTELNTTGDEQTVLLQQIRDGIANWLTGNSGGTRDLSGAYARIAV